MFGFKKKKISAEEAKKRQKELMDKARVESNLSLNKMKVGLKKLDKKIEDNVAKARMAKMNGDENTYNLAKSMLSVLIASKKGMNKAINASEVAVQMNDMSNEISEFYADMNGFARNMKCVSDGLDVTKTHMEMENIITKANKQTEDLNLLAINMENSFNKLSSIDTLDVDDEEVEKLINGYSEISEKNINKEIDEKLEDIKKVNKNIKEKE